MQIIKMTEYLFTEFNKKLGIKKQLPVHMLRSLDCYDFNSNKIYIIMITLTMYYQMV